LVAVQANNALKLGPFIIFNPDPENGVIGPNITFSGANIHIVSGGQTTTNPTGLGNLIIGYDEVPTLFRGLGREKVAPSGQQKQRLTP
jgi:hypothetical protein